MTANSKVAIPQEDALGLAIEFDKSVLAALSDKVGEEVRVPGEPGKRTMAACRACFRSIDPSVQAFIESRSMTLKAFYSAVAMYIVSEGSAMSLSRARGNLSKLWRNPQGLNLVCKYIVTRQEEIRKNKEVLRSILLSVYKLCNLTFTKERVARPSAIFDSIVKAGSLGRYLGGTLSYHFVALVPNIKEAIEQHASKRVDIYNTSVTRLDDEYAAFYDDLPRYKYEASQACKCLTGSSINLHGILPFTDEYYYNTYLPEHSKATNVQDSDIH